MNKARFALKAFASTLATTRWWPRTPDGDVKAPPRRVQPGSPESGRWSYKSDTGWG